MPTLDSQILAAFSRLRPHILKDPDELAHRLARRNRPMLTRPPRACCLAIRAADSRITPATAAIVPESAAYPRSAIAPSNPHPPTPAPHTVTIDSRLLLRLCRPFHIPPPGLPASEIAALLGIHPRTLYSSRYRGLFSTHYIPHLGGKRSHPIPLLYTDKPLDPAHHRLAMPDPFFGNIWDYRTPILPENFSQEIQRIPIYRSASDKDPDHIPTTPSRRLPKPPPDYVWYKWKNGVYIGDDAPSPPYSGERAGVRGAPSSTLHSPSSPRRRRKPSRSTGSLHFNGWRWLCPSCHRPTRLLYLPLPRINFLPLPLDAAHPDTPLLRHSDTLPTLACDHCHRVQFFSRASPNAWNDLITYLSDGLLFGHEVERPDSFTPSRQRPFHPQTNRKSPRRDQVRRRVLNGWSITRIARDLLMSPANVFTAIKRICAQENVPDRHALAAKLKSPHPQLLTARERGQRTRPQIESLLLQGQSPAQIASALELSRSATTQYISRIYAAHQVHTRTEFHEKLHSPETNPTNDRTHRRAPSRGVPPRSPSARSPSASPRLSRA